ncbi:MAG: TonB-dependent receptor [Candidatus Aminicenantes bacterium]|nr:TonB-dependent receptor [Candidatus Aminicenantes bacterium]
MRVKQGLILIFSIGIPLIFLGIAEEKKLWGQEKEKLLFEEIPVVITASRKAQPITEAPTAISVITADDIKYSGAANIPDVLRMVAGVDVMTITARDQQVGVWGFITPVNNKLLVLVDGRAIYTDLYGMVLWDLLPVGLDEIDRIEAVKSPASSIYGANAYSGVINIITKTPGLLHGTTLHVAGGERNTLITSILHAGELAAGKFKYKISAVLDRTRGWQEPGENTAEVLRFNALAEYSLGKKGRLALSAGRVHSKNRKLLSGSYIGAGLVDDKNDYLQVEAEFGRLKFRTFFKSEKPNIIWCLTGEHQTWNIATLNAELLHSFILSKQHALVWGIDYRYNTMGKNPFILKDHHQQLWAMFLEDEIKFNHKFRLTMGARYDRHPLVKGHLSPRGSISYSPSKNHIVKFSITQAYRNPSFVESYLYVEKQLELTLPAPFPPMKIPYAVISKGNSNLKPEVVTSYEIGYRSTVSRHLQLDLGFFYNRYENFFSLSRSVTFYNQNEIFPGFPGGVFPRTMTSSFENWGDGWGMGGEINLDFSLNNRVSGFFNYSYQVIKNKDDDPSSLNIDEKNRERPENPKNKANAGLRFLFKNGISLNLLAHWVDKTRKVVADSSGRMYLSPVGAYFLFNPRLGYTFPDKKAEIALAVFNLFNSIHYEYPMGDNPAFPAGEVIGRRVALSLEFKF